MRLLTIALALLAAAIVVAAIWLYTPDKPRAALEAQYATPDEFQTVAGIRLHLRDTGPRDAPAIILLHGFGSSLHTWEPWAERLSAQYRVVRYDLPGFGLTGPDPAGDYSDARSMAILAALMDHLGVARATIVGNSMGGKLAWQFAAAYPARVDRLVLVSPDGFASKGFAYGKRTEVPFVMKLLPYVMPTPLLRASLAPAYADPDRLTEPTITRYRDMMLAPGIRRAILDRTGQVLLENPEPALRSIQAPTLLLWGERDAMIPFANAADYLRALPHAKLAALPGLGHVPFEEAPEEALVPLLQFLAGGN